MVARPAQCHQVLNYISALAPTHPPGVDVMDVNSTGSTHLTRHELHGADAHGLKVYFSVFFQNALRDKLPPLFFPALYRLLLAVRIGQ